MRPLHARVLLAVATMFLAVPSAHATHLMAVFTFNGGFSTFPQFGPDVDNIPGTPTVTLLGNNAVGTPFPGNPFNDFEGTAWPAGDAVGYQGTNWIGNSIRVNFDRAGFDEIVFSYDYLSLANSGATSGIRVQGAPGFSQTVNTPYIGDGQWHRLSLTFAVSGLPSLLEIGTGPNQQSAPGLRLDNIQLLGVPEPSSGLLVLLGLLGCSYLRRPLSRITLSAMRPT